MSELNYTEIEEALGELLKADQELQAIGSAGVKVEVEEEFEPYPDKCPWIGIYLDTWDSPPEEERIGGQRPVTTFIMIELKLMQFSLEHRNGSKLRDQLIQKVKEVIKKNRNINGTVKTSRFRGGEFISAISEAEEGGFYKGVNIKLEVEVDE